MERQPERFAHFLEDIEEEECAGHMLRVGRPRPAPGQNKRSVRRQVRGLACDRRQELLEAIVVGGARSRARGKAREHDGELHGTVQRIGCCLYRLYHVTTLLLERARRLPERAATPQPPAPFSRGSRP